MARCCASGVVMSLWLQPRCLLRLALEVCFFIAVSSNATARFASLFSSPSYMSFFALIDHFPHILCPGKLGIAIVVDGHASSIVFYAGCCMRIIVFICLFLICHWKPMTVTLFTSHPTLLSCSHNGWQMSSLCYPLTGVG
mmetsp:Transcript_56872/g.120903  ORF Transcript_56872/g.120903 Transcript_56872/m.120903 type:complete len:140 (+) Transcript_56872:272-691(+)